jgi:hypothetical protein
MNKVEAINKIIAKHVDERNFPIKQYYVSVIEEVPVVLLHFSNPDVAAISEVYGYFFDLLRNYVDPQTLVIHATTDDNFDKRRFLMITDPEIALRMAQLYHPTF